MAQECVLLYRKQAMMGREAEEEGERRNCPPYLNGFNIVVTSTCHGEIRKGNIFIIFTYR